MISRRSLLLIAFRRRKKGYIVRSARREAGAGTQGQVDRVIDDDGSHPAQNSLAHLCYRIRTMEAPSTYRPLRIRRLGFADSPTSYSKPHCLPMLHLQSATSQRWLAQVDAHLDEVLIDHAHCEKKAAGTAMNLMFAYVQQEELCREMTVIVNEELEHFHQVLDILRQRQIRFRKLRPGGYGRRLHDLVVKQEPQRAVDRLLVAGLIEARSCERFRLLAEHVPDRPLAEFYAGLFESEARHHTTYVRLAGLFAPETAVFRRLEELARQEAAILAEVDPLPRMHS